MTAAAPARRRLRRLATGLLVLAAVGVLVRWQLLQTCLVPSDSMQPYLHGHPEHGDRVVVFKKAYWLREPRRFEPVVFETADQHYLVKRAVAFAGETVDVRGGDLFLGSGTETELRRYSKRYAELLPLLVPVWRGAFDGDFRAHFQLDRERARLEDGVLRLQGAPAAEDALACRYGAAVTNGFRDAEGRVVPGSEVVWDLLLRLQVVPEAPATGLVVELREDLDLFRFELDPAAEELRVLHILPDEDVVPSKATLGPWQPGRAYRVEVWNLDETLGVAVDGREVFVTRHRAVEPTPYPWREGPAFGAFGGAARVLALELDRDLHYTSVPGGPWTVAAGELFVLGDHSEASHDSRDFGPIPRERLVGRPLAVCLPWSRARLLE